VDNPGPYTLAALEISAAQAQALLTPITGLAGMTGVSLEANFQYGSGGSTVTAIVATSFDAGVTWRHIARFDFTTATAVKVCNLEGLLSKGVTVYADLASEGVSDGILGDQLAVFLTTTGTYASTQLSVRAAVR
jgi:hypothetical protein